MQWIRTGLHRDARAAKQHLADLERTGVAVGYGKTLEFLYGNLNILDAIASSLLSFNGVVLAALAIWLNAMERDLLHFVLDVVFFSLLVSCALCLRIVWMYWVSSADFEEQDEHLQRLLLTRDSRTAVYRAAWLLSIGSVVTTGIVAAIHTVATGWIAFGS